MASSTQITITKEKLLKLIEQVKDDLGIQTLIYQTILSQLPTAYADMLVRDYYFKHCHGKSYYVLSHSTGISIPFADTKSVEQYIWSVYPQITIRKVRQFLAGERGELYGYTIREEKGGA